LGDSLSVEVERLSSMAEGIARHHGMAVFVPGVLPGEIAEARTVKVARDFARAEPIQVTQLSGQRVPSKCPLHIDTLPGGRISPPPHCGGCQLQILSREEQLAFKQASVAETLARIGGIQVDVQPTQAGQAWHYRNKMAFTMTVRDRRLAWGLRSLEDGDVAVALPSCDISRPELWTAAEQIREALDDAFGPDLAWDGKTGVVRAVTLRYHTGRTHLPLSKSDRASAAPCVVSLFAVTSLDVSVPGRITAALSHLDHVHVFFTYSDPRATAVHFNSGRFLNRSPEGRSYWGEANLKEESCAWHTTGPWSTLVGPANFLQVNDEMAERLYQRVLDLPFEGHRCAIDTYCGVGMLTRALSSRFEDVAGIELDPQSIKLARTTSRRLGDCRVEWIAEAAEAVFSRSARKNPRMTPRKPDLVLVDPPRKGCQSEVLDALIDLKPADVVYISCHPAALARDLKTLCKRVFRVFSVEPFDLFPQTHHVETLVHLKRT
jgi:23S rRNA (uracil1939-C5)-methyltransferase